MNRRTKIIIIAVIVIVVLLLIIGIFWWFKNRQVQPNILVNTNQGIQIPTTLPQASAGLNTAEPSLVEEPQLEANLKAIAFTFTERFGSYSNEGNFSNLDSISDLMTVRMKAWMENYKASQKALISADQAYFGVTTKALSAEITEFDENIGRAEILVSTQRQEAKRSTINPRIYYQVLKLSLAKTGEGWKIDAAEWMDNS